MRCSTSRTSLNGSYFAPAYPWFFDVDGFDAVKVPNVSKAQQERNLRALNRLIDMAHDRGLRFSVGLWDHIYRGGVQSGGLTNADPNVPGPDRERSGRRWAGDRQST